MVGARLVHDDAGVKLFVSASPDVGSGLVVCDGEDVEVVGLVGTLLDLLPSVTLELVARVENLFASFLQSVRLTLPKTHETRYVRQGGPLI